MEGQIKCFLDKVKLKEFIITKPLLHEMLMALFKKRKIALTGVFSFQPAWKPKGHRFDSCQGTCLGCRPGPHLGV